MTNEVLGRANNIKDKIKDFSTLRLIARQPYQKFKLVKKLLWISDCHEDMKSVMCDKGLAELIEEYCNKRIKELNEELERL